mgnify:CR=1 FL=1
MWWKLTFLIQNIFGGATDSIDTINEKVMGQINDLFADTTKNVVVMFDGDQAGQTASERSLPILLAQGLFPRGCVLPDGLKSGEQHRGRQFPGSQSSWHSHTEDAVSRRCGRSIQCSGDSQRDNLTGINRA